METTNNNNTTSYQSPNKKAPSSAPPTSTNTSSTTTTTFKKRNQTSFTADSPYFTAYVDKEMKHLNVLTMTLRDISSKAKTFGKCGVLMSEATRRLSSACKLHGNGVGKGNHNGGGNDNDDDGGGDNFDENNMDSKERMIYEQRKKSVGHEMVGVLQVLGKVSEFTFGFGFGLVAFACVIIFL